jgi:hypothetical protein
VDGSGYGVQDITDNLGMVGVGFNGLDSRCDLQRVSRVDNQDPVAMAEHGHGLFDTVSPGWRGHGLGSEDCGAGVNQQEAEDVQ